MIQSNRAPLNLYNLEELHSSKWSILFNFLDQFPSFSFIRDKLLNRIISSERGIYFSYTVRQVLYKKHNIILGSYSYGNLYDLYQFPIKTVIGRFTSIGPGVRIYQANHPIEFVSTHPFFFRSDIGIVEKEAIQRHELVIGHDVWLGANTIICPGCHRIGNGAVAGAGAVITKDVPDYAIVGGNPAKVIKMRFNNAVITKLLETCWWQFSYEKIKNFRKEMTQSLDENHLDELCNKLGLLQAKDKKHYEYKKIIQ